MKKFFSLFTVAFLVFAFGCQHGAKDSDATKGEIKISKVKVASQPCSENAEIEVDGTEALVIVEFAESYAGLNVKIGEKPATINGKEAKVTITGITETLTEIKILAKATGRVDKEFKFKVKSKHVEPQHIVISKVKVASQPCSENAEIEVDGTEALVIVEFAESYAGLNVKIGEKPATINGKEAKVTITGITETLTEIKILAKATGRVDKEFKFKVKKALPVADINELVFEAKKINPTASYMYQDQKVYSNDPTHPPLLSDIASDGSTKVGDAHLPTVNVKVRYKSGASEQKLKVENTTTGKTEETNTLGYSNINLSIALKAGDNSLTITYSEKDKKSLVYKVIVGYIEPEYEPINLIQINREFYNTKQKFAALEAGTETLNIDGVPSVDVKITMPELWYNEDGWQLTLDEAKIEKTAFTRTGFSMINYSVEKKVPLVQGGIKVLKIVFENTNRSYKKEYSLSINHKIVNKIKSIVLIDSKVNEKVDSNNENHYKFDVAKDYYKTKNKVILKDRLEKATILVTPQDDEIIPKYAFSTTDVSSSSIPSWQVMTKKSVTYNNYGNSITEETYVIEEKQLNHGIEFLYVLLEKAGTKTYYVTEIEREKVAIDNVEKESEEKIYQDANGGELDKTSPIAKKGMIRVLPKSPRATVMLLTPEAKAFTLNATDGYYECVIPLPNRETNFSYKIVAENTTSEQTYQGSFVKSVLIKDFKFDYKKDGSQYNRTIIDELDGKYYLAFDKKEVKENKLYLFIQCYKGLDIACAEFSEFIKEDGYSGTDYTATLDVASLMTGPDTKKEYIANLTLSGESLAPLHLTVYPEDDIIQTLHIGYTSCMQLPDDKYICKADIDFNKPRKVEVGLWLVEGETPENTERKIRILEGGVEKPVVINKSETSKLEFVHDGLTISDKQKITLKIEYYAKKDDLSPTRTYTLEIEDI